jgi:hypothetical protein
MRPLAGDGDVITARTWATNVGPFASLVVGIVLLQLAWAIALPIFRGPDEIEHTKRASGVASGEVFVHSERGIGQADTVTVEKDLVTAQRDVCDQLHSDFDDTICAPAAASRSAASSGTETYAMRSTAIRYNPAWYVLVAPASWLLEGEATAWGMRALTALVCALVLAWAVSLHRAAGSGRHADIGMMFCVTPAVVFASVVAAPNGLHFAAALVFWVALLGVAPGRRQAWGACIGGAIMSLTHTLGPFWILCALIVLATLRGVPHMRRLFREVISAAPAFVLFLSAQAFALGWVVTARTNDPTGGGDVLAESTKEIPAFAHGIVWVLQSIGTMPFRFGLLWPIVYVLWLLPLMVFLWRAVRSAYCREKVAMATVVTLAAAIPAAVTAVTYENHGYAWQGRYELPLIVALPLIAGGTVGRRAFPMVQVTLYVLVTGVAVALGTLCLALREGSNVAEAILAFALSTAGWWLLWFPGSRVEAHVSSKAATELAQHIKSRKTCGGMRRERSQNACKVRP